MKKQLNDRRVTGSYRIANGVSLAGDRHTRPTVPEMRRVTPPSQPQEMEPHSNKA
jgi:hypothetical protein